LFSPNRDDPSYTVKNKSVLHQTTCTVQITGM
jgi:hypothetical protein